METPPRAHHPRFAVLLGLQFLSGLGFSSFLLLPKYLTEVHGSDPDVIGLMVSAGPVAALAAVPLLARHIDRLPLRWLLGAGALGMAVCSLGFASLTAPGAGLALLRVVQGAGFVVFYTCTTVMASQLAAPERLAQALGLLGAANLATNAIAPALAEVVATAYGWRPVFLGSAAASLLAASAALHFRPQGRPAAAIAHDGSDLPRPIWQPRFLRLVYAGAMVGVSFGAVITFYQPLALEVGIRDVRDLFVGYTASALFVRIALGGFLDRFDRRRVAFLAASLYALVVLATAGLRPGLLLPLGLGLGFAHGTLWPVLTALTVEGSDDRVRGSLLTWFGGSFHLGVTLSTLGFGFLASAVGYRAVLAVAAAGAASGAGFLLRLERATAPSGRDLVQVR